MALPNDDPVPTSVADRWRISFSKEVLQGFWRNEFLQGISRSSVRQPLATAMFKCVPRLPPALASLCESMPLPSIER